MTSVNTSAHPIRRAVLLVAATVTGLVLVLSYRTPANTVSVLSPVSQSHGSGLSASGSGGAGNGDSSGNSGGGANVGQKSTPPSAPSSAPQTATGNVVNTPYGPVQVRVTVQSRRITDVQAVALPSGGYSSQVNNYASPQLREQALAAQSANIHGVAGASFTSQAYQQSLQSALTQLGM